MIEKNLGGFVIAATGLAAEARIAERAAGVHAVVGGGDAERLASELRKSIAKGGRAIISFGIAGGLQSSLRPGACLVGRRVIAGNQLFDADAAWTARICALVPDITEADVAGVTAPVANRQQKAALHIETRAAVADMESGTVARIAVEHGLPFAVIRVVADTADRDLPPAALIELNRDGTPNIRAVLTSLLAQPTQLPALAGVGLDAGRAMRRLLRCHRSLGARLGFTDLDQLVFDVA